MRTNLTVDFKDKEKVKRLGAKWDDARKTWYVENVDNLVQFLQWIDSKLKMPTTSKPLKHPKFKKKKCRKAKN